MRLLDLDPSLRRILDERTHDEVGDIGTADGVMFLCPACFITNRGPIGTHSVICWRPRVPQSWPPTPGRWELQGTSLADLSLVAGSSSVLLQGGCNAHFFVQKGQIVWCGPAPTAPSP